LAGDDEGGYLEPYVGTVCNVGDSIEDGLEFGFAEAAVVVGIEGLEVYVDGVEPFFCEVDGLDCHVAVADEDIREGMLLCKAAGVVAEFHEDCRLCVCVGDASAAGAECGGDDLLRSYGLAFDSACIYGGLADVPVLAELAAEIAADARDGKAAGAGLEMEEGLFFDWVGVGGADLVVVERVEGAVDVLSYAAVAEIAVADKASPAAEAAADLFVTCGPGEDGLFEVFCFVGHNRLSPVTVLFVFVGPRPRRG